MSQFYFVAGASGSGKTALMPDLKKIMRNAVAIYDFDDMGVPIHADTKWRQESTEKWLQKLFNDGKNACLLGQIVLGEILACPSAQHINEINFLLLDVNDFERMQRLRKHNTYGANQSMLNWSSWLRMHHQDPTWMQHVLKENCWSNLNFNTWDHWTNWHSKINIKMLNTTKLSVFEVAQSVAEWIKEKELS